MEVIKDRSLGKTARVFVLGVHHVQLDQLFLRLFLRGNELQQAEDHFAAAIEIQPKVPDAHYYLGLILHSKGQTPEGVKCFRRAIELNFEFVLALHALAWVYSTHADDQIGNGGEAVALAERAGDHTLARRIHSRLALYLANPPFRRPPP